MQDATSSVNLWRQIVRPGAVHGRDRRPKARLFEDGYNSCDPAMAARFVDWAEHNGIQIQYIQPGKPNQNGLLSGSIAFTVAKC